jgi:mono/diheme cytochrome c family protein
MKSHRRLSETRNAEVVHINSKNASRGELFPTINYWRASSLNRFPFYVAFAFALMLCAVVMTGTPQATQRRLPSDYVPSGETMYKQYCATCHGADGKGHGPAATEFRAPTPDLTTLAARHDDKFPYAYVYDVLFWGRLAAHGSPQMPVWGPIFRSMDKRDEKAVRKRIENISAYLVCIQTMEPRECSPPAGKP